MKILTDKRQAARVRPASVDDSFPQAGRAGSLTLATFKTSLGWMGLLGLDDDLVAVYVGHPSTASIGAAAGQFRASIRQRDWNPDARRLLEAYAEGEAVDFSDVPLRLPAMTRFRQLIISATRQIGYGETTSYGELAKRIGHPGAARAVGTVMSTNRFPILIPCHRVLAAGGHLGGYTSPAGLDLKRRLLMMEAQGQGVTANHLHAKWTLDR